MNNLVTLMSQEAIKPSSPCSSKPFKLSFFDQLMPISWIPVILFYPPNQLSQNSNFSSTLKLSLSQTLATFFPFSGRLKDSLFVHNFDEGIPFSETKVAADLCEFLRNPELDKLNQFLPTQPFTQGSLSSAKSLPLLYAQLNRFQRGGIALAISFCHKISDAYSVSYFLKKWSENNVKVINDLLNEDPIAFNFDEPSLRFPPLNSNPYTSIMENFLFIPGKHTTRRFVFDSNAISSLQEKATTESESGVKLRPTRVRTISSFIWKCFTKASASISLTPRTSVSVHAVNFRKRTEPVLSEYSIGNYVWMAVAPHDIVDSDANLKDFVGLTNECIEGVNAEFLKSLEGEKGSEVVSQFLGQLNSTNNPEIIIFSSWVNFGIHELDFGLGKPAWVSLMGELCSTSRNFTVLIKCCNGDGIEVWINLDHDKMEILEHDPEFIKFATPNPPIFIHGKTHPGPPIVGTKNPKNLHP